MPCSAGRGRRQARARGEEREVGDAGGVALPVREDPLRGSDHVGDERLVAPVRRSRAGRCRRSGAAPGRTREPPAAMPATIVPWPKSSPDSPVTRESRLTLCQEAAAEGGVGSDSGVDDRDRRRLGCGRAVPDRCRDPRPARRPATCSGSAARTSRPCRASQTYRASSVRPVTLLSFASLTTWRPVRFAATA